MLVKFGCEMVWVVVSWNCNWLLVFSCRFRFGSMLV